MDHFLEILKVIAIFGVLLGLVVIYIKFKSTKKPLGKILMIIVAFVALFIGINDLLSIVGCRLQWFDESGNFHVDIISITSVPTESAAPAPATTEPQSTPFTATPEPSQGILTSYTFGLNTEGQSMQWRVLDSENNQYLLLCEELVTVRAYDKKSTTWDDSDLRAWLVNVFYEKAFSSDEKDRMLPIYLSDRITIPTLNDLTNSNYDFSENANGYDTNRLCAKPYTTSEYYTRTVAKDFSLFHVRSDGSIGPARYDRTNVGCRPMILIRIDN